MWYNISYTFYQICMSKNDCLLLYKFCLFKSSFIYVRISGRTNRTYLHERNLFMTGKVYVLKFHLNFAKEARTQGENLLMLYVRNSICIVQYTLGVPKYLA